MHLQQVSIGIDHVRLRNPRRLTWVETFRYLPIFCLSIDGSTPCLTGSFDKTAVTDTRLHDVLLQIVLSRDVLMSEHDPLFLFKDYSQSYLTEIYTVDYCTYIFQVDKEHWMESSCQKLLKEQQRVQNKIRLHVRAG